MAEEDNSQQKGRSLYYQRFSKDSLPAGGAAYGAPYGAPYGNAYGAPYGSGYGAPGGGDEGGGGTMSVGRILRVCSSHWMTIFVFLVLGLLCAFIVFQLLPQKFESVAYYEMTVQGRSLVGEEGDIYSGSDNSLESVFNTRYTQFQTTEVQDRVIERYRSKNPDKGISTATLRDILANESEMKLLPRSRLVTVTVVASDPKLAADLANAYVEVCEEFMSEQNKLLADNAVVFLTTTLAEEERRLSEIEEDLLEERKSQRIESLNRERELVQSRLSALDTQSIDLERQIAIAKDLINGLAIVKETPDRFTVIPEEYRSSEIVSAYERWQTALNERKTLLIRLTEKHPDVILKDREVQVFREQFVEVAQRAYDTGITQLKFLESQRQPIVEEAAKVRAEIIKLDGDILAAQMRVQQLERQREIGIGKTLELRERQRVASLKADENAAAIRSVRDALPAEKPASPNPYIIFTAGVLIGLLLGVLFVLLLDHMEDKLVGVADIEQRLRLKALVVFPHLRRKQRNQVALTMHDSPFSQYAESMAGLRNLLDSPRYHGLTKAILSMSTQPGEGKTCTSTNLAIAYAQSGQRTLLVDFDMRRPRLAGIFGRSPDSFPSLPHTLAKNDASLFDRPHGHQHHHRLLRLGPQELRPHHHRLPALRPRRRRHRPGQPRRLRPPRRHPRQDPLRAHPVRHPPPHRGRRQDPRRRRQQRRLRPLGRLRQLLLPLRLLHQHLHPPRGPRPLRRQGREGPQAPPRRRRPRRQGRAPRRAARPLPGRPACRRRPRLRRRLSPAAVPPQKAPSPGALFFSPRTPAFQISPLLFPKPLRVWPKTLRVSPRTP